MRPCFGGRLYQKIVSGINFFWRGASVRKTARRWRARCRQDATFAQDQPTRGESRGGLCLVLESTVSDEFHLAVGSSSVRQVIYIR